MRTVFLSLLLTIVCLGLAAYPAWAQSPGPVFCGGGAPIYDNCVGSGPPNPALVQIDGNQVSDSFPVPLIGVGPTVTQVNVALWLDPMDGGNLMLGTLSSLACAGSPPSCGTTYSTFFGIYPTQTDCFINGFGFRVCRFTYTLTNPINIPANSTGMAWLTLDNFYILGPSVWVGSGGNSLAWSLLNPATGLPPPTSIGSQGFALY
jgi:hypothetical protein